MLRKAFGNNPSSLSSVEDDQVVRLVQTQQQLVHDGGRLDMKSEAGFNACTRYLEQIDAASRALNIEPAPRGYRGEFTINYRALFPDEARNYRVDVLEASAEQYNVIWVNGENFQFSNEAMLKAEALQRACVDLKTCLHRWGMALESPTRHQKPSRAELQNALMVVDNAWACFEHKYITELISIEEKARQLIVDAIQKEKRLSNLEQEQQKEGKSNYGMARQEVISLVRCIAKLNSIANVRRKGRDDLSPEILFAAQAAMKPTCQEGAASAARILAADVVDSFEAMRNYLREVNNCLERVDPHLCNNAGLVSRLVDWEESWEIGAKYVQHEALLRAVCDVVETVRAAQRLAPALVDMCTDCSVELFMVLPRIIWLRFLIAPERLVELLRTLLPHRFQLVEKEADHTPWDSNLAAFIDKFRSVEETVCGSSDRSKVHAKIWETVVRRVVSGESGESAYGHLTPTSRAVAEPAVEELMHLLEGHSIELQRHCAGDWNQCSAILVQCLSSGDDKEDGQKDPFSV
jgi:hypothetical protein